ncbi:hypothetical protein ABB37_03208 [Leptomonas pyrrhocoris]|uniref:Uncharacterized protein n=1 Tax=Leptomonas pyrrhocoris TaxID=157538 RepID=A0A0M9G443_LEPPY|nr:hypothetical protein ABB37_03208 [Leptomonas pyrrhocoris]XP_015660479.1 hypothetical protein ABB37_03208 [Leptomonas pyrrhocoris]KPA82039.1 hypothetical protein ABB37_03208 [Leptomonas pyrrhocoris]KPA82040.1 hypothetical protein ABB37_03208 [Leptomonas pyrrhocoris]|eukprot:XP_015660478.1 hypothetical protein ABB37_03208 [Leptomonas pyrrhocoris]
MSVSADVLPSPVVMEPPSYTADGFVAVTSPHTPPSAPPNSANHRLVRPLLRQRKNTLQQASHGLSGQRASPPAKPSLVSSRYPEEKQEEGSGTAEERGSTEPADNESKSPALAASTTTTTTSSTKAPFAAATCYQTESDGDDVRTELSTLSAVHYPPIHSSAAANANISATQPRVQRPRSSRPGPLLLPRTDATLSLASYPSNLSCSVPVNNSASSSLAGISSLSKQGNPTEGACSAGPKLSSPSTALSGNGERVGLNGRPAPPLLRSSLFTPTLNDDARPSSALLTTYQVQLNGPVSVSPQLHAGPTPPHISSSTASVTSGGATPLSGSRSSARPSFTRTLLPTSAVSPTEVPSPHAQANGGPAVLQRNGSSSAIQVVNGRVLASPRVAQRPPLSARRITFDRSASTVYSNDGPTSASASRKGAESGGVKGGLEESCGAGDRVEPMLTKEMRKFVLGQYRSLQRDVRTLATATEQADAPAQTDVSATDFVHIKRSTCPRHSKTAVRAAQKKQEEERLRALQQRHHDMEIIRNGGREQVSANMKSSAVLAGSLSKLRSRHKSNTQAGSVNRMSNSLDCTISAAFEAQASPFGSPDEVNGTALYGASSYSSSSHEKLTQGGSEAAGVKGRGEMDATPEDKTASATAATTEGGEAWHSSKFFLPARTTSAFAPAAEQERRNSRTVNKNGMKGEAIVVAVVPDSDEDEESEEEAGKRGTQLRRTKGDTEVHRPSSLSMSAPSSDLKDLTVSVTTASAAKRAGERLPTKSSSHPPQQRSTKPCSSSLLLSNTHGDSDDSGSNGDDDDAYFSFNKQRSQRLRSTPSLSSTQPLDQQNLSITQPSTPPRASALSPDRVGHRREHMPRRTRRSSSDMSAADDDDGSNENACCFCCPCRRPENFFVLCRASREGGSFGVARDAHEPLQRRHPSSPALPHTENERSRHEATKPAPTTATQPSNGKGDVNTSADSHVLFEDLEDASDDDEPLLSMQSFRRTSIQRVR